ncbi:BA71V-C147L (g6L) [African swine fever virus]|uniref:DNA-directed RNA polymerase subunit 6 homolog n=2 Tax=African swine fever virus TaxID=10497 RepID=RPB6_ASFK5|nr:BA71V-C147L (g6L) [African swine fever virus]YP_009702968.1 BA71V-C147L (g6L) [African swine fever virus]P0C9D9.1 RecName: Full=DNA-directed RNA polymerase subunit 6 homolog; Short=RPB6 homolog [African swine fever virus pig/Kenya/KEN-50/1950]UYB79224.1 pC147L [Recombinant African swine fever virus]AJL34083.1 BA71V-C147L (g6L) [African swine fever virus]AJL34248.1 BA71V-C147L (g6L) [African swine fever virus]AXB49298.1 pC147L [African swine fever virus]AXB49472.1 pC147L [African swine fev
MADNDNEDSIMDDLVEEYVETEEENFVDSEEESEDKDEIVESPSICEGFVQASSQTLVVIPDNERITSNVLTTFEATRLVAVRAQQLAINGSTMLKKKYSSPIDIAKQELFNRKIPLLVMRCIKVTPDGQKIVEIWNPREMGIPLLD